IWYAPGDTVNGADDDLEAQFSGFCIAAVTIVEYSGLLRASTVLDQSAISEDDTGSGIGQTGPTSVTTQADELWVGGIAAVADPTMGAPGSDFTQVGVTQDSGIMRMVSADQIVEAQGVAGFALSLVPDSPFVGAVATFKRR